MSDFAVPREERHFEDYVQGETHEFGPLTVSEEEILEFAGRYDPQLIHTDPEYAATGPYGGLIASGWHTTGLFMRLFTEFLPTTASLGSPGLDELRWLAPVRPGDALRLRTEIVEARVSRSKPDRGLVRTNVALVNQDDVTVLTMSVVNIMRRRSVAH